MRNFILLRSSYPRRARQQGAVLLVFMLVLIVGSSYMLVSRLNEYTQAYKRLSKTQIALEEAKLALLNYAMNYPDLENPTDRTKGPGYLPCPDEGPNTTPSPVPTKYEDSLNDGRMEANCADSTGSTFGRLPYKDLGLADLRDSSGERLWYAVSQNFKYNQSSNHVLNSDTPGTISVDGAGDVVAVIVAPGEPLSSQSGRHNDVERDQLLDRKAYLVADEYVESDNATVGDLSYISSDSGDFNDQVVAITRAELMAVVEQRVVNEARRVLAQYQGSYAAYPWLSPFADPASDNHGLTGTHTGSDNSASLQDTSSGRDFTLWGVALGDTVWNLTDGSYGTVTAVTATSITLSGLSLGTDNDFDQDDEYYIDVAARSSALSGRATTGSASLTLVDADEDGGGADVAKDFEELGVSAGDVVDNISDGSSGIVETVDGDQLTVGTLSGATGIDPGICPGKINAFCPADTYRIRNDAGRSTSNSAGLLLEDTYVNFVTMGVQVGDLVRNITDGSFGTVAIVPNPSDVGYTCPGACNQLTLGSLDFGSGVGVVCPAVANQFCTGDYYVIPRFNGVASTRKGLLSMHLPGETFPTGFDVGWSALAANGNTVSVTTAGTDTNYSNPDSTINSGIERWVERSQGYSGAISIPNSSGECTWIAEQIADCRGVSIDAAFLSSTATAVSGVTAGNKSITNTAVDFNAAGAKPGDKISDSTNGLSGIVSRIYSTNPRRIRVRGITGYTAFNAAVGDSFRVSVATGAYTNSADSVDATNNVVCSTGADFSFVTPNVDAVRDNSNTSSSGQQFAVGLITNVPSSNCITYSPLAGGSTFTGGSDMVAGHSYTVLYNFIDQRQYRFAGRISGTEVTAATGGVRQRSVCLGYDDSTQTGPDCAGTSPSNPSLATGNTATITIEDYSGATKVGAATATIPATGTHQASIRLSGINYQLEQTADSLPAWFLKNKWHRLLYAAYSSGYQPGGAGACIAGTDCLQLSVPLPAGKTYNDRQALVVSAGAQLAAQASNRTTGALSAYFESDNAVDTDDLFKKGEGTSSFNDQISVVSP